MLFRSTQKDWKSGRPVKDALPENYKNLSLDEQFDILMDIGIFDAKNNPNGIKPGEYHAEYRKLRELEDRQEKIAARREALAERIKKTSEAGPVSEGTRRFIEGEGGPRAPRTPKTPEQRAAEAKKERQRKLTGIENAVGKMQNKIGAAIIQDNASEAHRVVWDEAMDLLLQEDDGEDADLKIGRAHV